MELSLLCKEDVLQYDPVGLTELTGGEMEVYISMEPGWKPPWKEVLEGVKEEDMSFLDSLEEAWGGRNSSLITIVSKSLKLDTNNSAWIYWALLLYL